MENANANDSGNSSAATPHFGLLGRTLGHSYTPAIYRALVGIDYRFFEREPEDVEAFIRGDEWAGVNVTIPYKRTVVPFLDELTPLAERMGNVNTITRLPDGRLRGDNTDYFGFKTLVESLGLALAGKKALVFGHGGAGTTCGMVLEDMGMRVVFCGRTVRPGAITYDQLPEHADAALAVNCTPAGMWPNCPAAPCSLQALKNLEGVVDIVYNPARTGLIMDAEQRGIPCASGLLMLVAQAAQAVERYTGQAVSLKRIHEVTDLLRAREQNITLIGMPGAGKTRVGQALARTLGRDHVDLDQEFAARLGMGAAAYIERHGERAFREQETAIAADVCGRSRLVVSCGGGIVTRDENYPLLHQNSLIVMLDRPLDELPHHGRPITARDGIEKLAQQRLPRYRAWADLVVTSRRTPQQTAAAIAEQLPPMLP